MSVWKHFVLLLTALVLPAATLFAQPALVNSARYSADANQAKIIFGISDTIKYRAYVLENPSRLVVDFKNAKAKHGLTQPPASHPLFKQIRTAQKDGSELRLVIDLKHKITGKTHALTSQNVGENQVVINLQNKQNQQDTIKSSRPAEKTADKSAGVATARTDIVPASASVKNTSTAHSKRFIVAIDAGHGGDDPGATGPNGTREKVVTLAISRKLHALINSHPGMKARLVRKGDYYVGLRDRMRIARLNRADLFISIHADAVNNPDVRGASVYTLSRNGASSEAARWLANHENAKEKLGGVNLEDKDEVLASVLLDLSQTATQQASTTLAGKVLKNFQGIGSLHYHAVQKAGFAVLKSPDIPSLLVETAYISNPSDELNLMSTRYQNKIANAIFRGVLDYVEQMQPSDINKMAKL